MTDGKGGPSPSNSLFTGTEDAANIPDPVDGSGAASGTVSFSAFVGGLTWDEAHALFVGFFPMLAGCLLTVAVPGVGRPLIAFALALTVALAFEARLGMARPLRYLVREYHYYLAGQFTAALLGSFLVGLLTVLSVWLSLGGLA